MGLFIDTIYHNLGPEVLGLQPFGRYHHQLQKYLFRVCHNLKIEMEASKNTNTNPAPGCQTECMVCKITILASLLKLAIKVFLAGGLFTIEGNLKNAVISNDVTGAQKDLFPGL